MARGQRTVIDLFCGAGGFSEGFRSAGFKILAGIDSDPAAAASYRHAHSEAQFFETSIENLSPRSVRSKLGLKKGDLDCLIGGPPCQSYSINNHQRGLRDKRSKLFRSYIEFVKVFLPKYIVIENVTGILSAGKGRAVKEIQEALISLGYNVALKTHSVEQYGVPQARRRVIILGAYGARPLRWPSTTSRITRVKDAIGDLPVLKNGAGSETAEFTKNAHSSYQRRMRVGSKLLYNHVTPLLSAVNLQRIQHVPPGGSWRDIPFKLLPLGMRRAKRSDHTKRYGRLDPNGLASTILTKCDPHWGAFVHPSQNRALSVREAARLQSFPDKYRFFGTKTEQFVQVGNAVPPLFAKALGSIIKRML